MDKVQKPSNCTLISILWFYL